MRRMRLPDRLKHSDPDGALRLALGILVGIALVAGLIGFGVYWNSEGSKHRAAINRANIVRNGQAIRVSCVLLAQAIASLGVADRADNSTLSPQALLNELRLQAIRQAMTSAQRRRERDLMDRAVKAGQGVRVPDCEAIVRNPESVKTTP